mgnify:CR=1 FL=1
MDRHVARRGAVEREEISGALPDGITESFDTTFASVSVTGLAQLGDSLWLSTRRGIGLAHLSAQLTDWRPMNAGLTATDVKAFASDGASLFAQVGGEVYRWRQDLAQWQSEPGAGWSIDSPIRRTSCWRPGRAGAFRWRLSATDSGWTALPGAPRRVAVRWLRSRDHARGGRRGIRRAGGVVVRVRPPFPDRG